MAQIVIYGKPACTFCQKAKAICERHQLPYEYKLLDEDFTREQLFEEFPTAKTFPQIKVNGQAVGGYDQFIQYLEDHAYTGTGYTL